MLDMHPKLQKWDERSRPLIAVAAIAPFLALAIIPDEYENVFVAIDVASWLVFVFDFAVRTRLWKKYPSTGNGIFDLVIVVLTFPWYLLPVAASAEFLSVFRIARLVRLLTSMQLLRRTALLTSRFGVLGIWIVGTSIFSALIVLKAEPPSSGFEDFGDAIWWTIVSFTTVGYGDLYPVSALGRFAGAIMMFTGLAALGSVAAILGSVLGMGSKDEDEEEKDRIVLELQDLRNEIAQVRLAIESQHPDSGDGTS